LYDEAQLLRLTHEESQFIREEAFHHRPVRSHQQVQTDFAPISSKTSSFTLMTLLGLVMAIAIPYLVKMHRHAIDGQLKELHKFYQEKLEVEHRNFQNKIAEMDLNCNQKVKEVEEKFQKEKQNKIAQCI